MARTKGMLNLSGNLEVNAQAPLDARTIVPTEADLTVASNFPYPYVGLEVYVTGTDKKFRLTNLDVTQSSSWHEIGEGGGGETYSDFTGATSSTAGAHGLVPAPSAGDEGKVLFGNGSWGALPSVDLSVLSNEAFQFSPTEKPVGTWTDSNNVTKLVYAKTIFIQSGTLSAGRTNAVPHGVSNIDKKMLLTGALRYGTSTKDLQMPFSDDYKPITNSMLCISSITDTDINISVGSDYVSPVAIASGFVAILYTKTTDSPLPSGVKFAGVDENGNVLLKKHVVTTTPTSPTTMAMYTDANAIIKDVSMPYFDMGSDGFFTMLHSGLCNYTISANRHSVNGWISSGASNFTNKPCEFDVYFTLAS